MKHYHLNQHLSVNRGFAIKLADLRYDPSSDRPDDCGSLYVAPVSQASWDAPIGLLALYATTNGDPVVLAQIEENDLTWIDENNSDVFPEHMRTAMESAGWSELSNDEAAELLELVRNAIPAGSAQ